ncbi:hypothetical protein [Paenibacillus senegalensis]|uniref:hypothetical protein n=1 Tax=Paenibacillus senegalensis TaxID=1465766 RepID=UPI0002883A9F|nr:hypothetical protein [Paenibacillus senegalensis]
MLKPYRPIVLLCLCLLLIIPPQAPVKAAEEPSLEQARDLLQKSLTITEMDREIERLTEQEKRIEAQLLQTEANMARQQVNMEQARDQAGKVLRAYYMGERNDIWTLLLRTDSFSDAIAVYQYLTMIFVNDRKRLTAYSDSYQRLEEMREELIAYDEELKQIKEAFIIQRDQRLALQQEMDEGLANNPEATEVFKQMVDLTTAWKDKGLPLFRKYFEAISNEMQSISELLADDNRNQYLNGLTFQISDQELIRFFRSRNPLFNNLEFSFQDGYFMAEGQEDDVEVTIKGQYVLEMHEASLLRFYVEELTFNGFVLPESTNRSLEEEFPLGFSPESIVGFLQASEISTEDGMLTLKLKLKLR